MKTHFENANKGRKKDLTLKRVWKCLMMGKIRKKKTSFATFLTNL